jgi:choline dehydrogenase-like flavoprotein
MPNPYDAIIIGTGAGGGTLALHLAQAGKRVLILERGPFLPQEKLNWDTSAVFLDNRYHTKDVWLDKDNQPLHPQQAYFVGGQTKVYGAALFRLRAEDFRILHHKDGISPARPLTYADFEPYYTRAEELFAPTAISTTTSPVQTPSTTTSKDSATTPSPCPSA